MPADLHMHTTCSDGVLSPEELAREALAAGLSVIAITDHDTLAAYDGSHVYPQELRIIRGIEMSSDYGGEDVHILGYYVNPADADLQEYCSTFKKRRLERAQKMIRRCAALGYPLSAEEAETVVTGNTVIGRPHIARLLVKTGYFPDVKTVFDKILYRGGPAYIPYERHTVDECIDLIHGAGGIAVLAHPALVKKHLADVVSYPFDGMEVYHPRNIRREDEFLCIARQRGFLVSGGSDFHGTAGRFPEKIGVFTVDEADVAALLSYGKGEN